MQLPPTARDARRLWPPLLPLLLPPLPRARGAGRAVLPVCGWTTWALSGGVYAGGECARERETRNPDLLPLLLVNASFLSRPGRAAPPAYPGAPLLARALGRPSRPCRKGACEEEEEEAETKRLCVALLSKRGAVCVVVDTE